MHGPVQPWLSEIHRPIDEMSDSGARGWYCNNTVGGQHNQKKDRKKKMPFGADRCSLCCGFFVPPILQKDAKRLAFFLGVQ